MVNERYWKTLCEKKAEKFKNSKEYETITEVLNDLHPNRFELNIVYPEASEVEFSKFNMRHNIWNSFESRLAEYMRRSDNKIDHYLKMVRLECIIHYPVVNIQNRNKLKHKIRDLYVKIAFPLNNANAIIDLNGTRATISKTEYDARYAHSHLPRGSYQRFNNFCTGSSEMGCCIQKEFITTNKSSIYQFLFLLQSYLEYESIEGIPHVRMENCQNLTDIDQIRIEDKHLKELLEVKLPIKLNNKLKIVNTEEIELLLADRCNYVVTKIDGKYYSILDSYQLGNIENINGLELFEFKGKKIKLTIDNYATETKPTKYCHPKYREAVIRYWENQIFKTFIRKYRISRQSSSKNIRKSVESNQVSM